MPIYLDFEDNTMVMDENEPSSAQAHEKREKAKAEKAAKMPPLELASWQPSLSFLSPFSLELVLMTVHFQS